MPGGAKGAGAAAGGGSSGGGGGSGGAFEDYDEEEVAALEAYMKTHPTKEEDKEALRKRAKELSASIGSGKVKRSKSEILILVFVAGLPSSGPSSRERERDEYIAVYL